MRVLLVAVGLLLAGALIWILQRPAGLSHAAQAETVVESAEAPHAVGATASEPPDLTPTLERVALPTEKEERQERVAELPHTSVRVRIFDAFEVLEATCKIQLVITLPDGRRATGEREVDERGECWFEVVPLGQCRMTLEREWFAGRSSMTLLEQELELHAGRPVVHEIDLRELVVELEIECANPPRDGLESVEVSSRGSILAEWDADDPDAGILPGTLRVWAPLGEEVDVQFDSIEESYVESRAFSEPGQQRWRVELPTGELHLYWQPPSGIVRFILESEEPLAGKSLRSAISSDGRTSFGWLMPGNYLARAGTMVKGDFHERARSFVQMGSTPQHLTLETAAVCTLRFILPELPTEERHYVGPKPDSPRTVATLYPAGKLWPVYASKPCGNPDTCHFESVLAGDYDLVIAHGLWVSRNRVSIGADHETVIKANGWVGLTIIEVGLLVRPGQSPIADAQLTTSEGAVLDMYSANDEFLKGAVYQMFVISGALPGSARLAVTAEDGTRAEFELVISTGDWDTHVFEMPPP